MILRQVCVCSTLCNPMDCRAPARLLCPWNSPSKNTRVGCYALFQGILSTQGLNMGSLTAQLVKNLPAMQETWLQFLGWEDPLEKEMAIHSSILAWKIPDRGAWQAAVYGVARVRHVLATKPPTTTTSRIAGRFFTI